VAYAANIETIRINRWELYEDFSEKVASLDTTAQTLDIKALRPGYVYIINNIVAIEAGTKPTTIAIGYVRTGKFYLLTRKVIDNDNESLEYVGQVLLREGDVIRAIFYGATEGDTADVYANGYKIKP